MTWVTSLTQGVVTCRRTHVLRCDSNVLSSKSHLSPYLVQVHDGWQVCGMLQNVGEAKRKRMLPKKHYTLERGHTINKWYPCWTGALLAQKGRS